MRYSGLFALGTRSASGLETILRDSFNNVKIKIIQGVERIVKIPVDQKASLGYNTKIGVNTLLGEQCIDHANAFQIEVGPVAEDDFRHFFPQGKYHHKLVSYTKLYIAQPFEYNLDIILDKKENTQTTQLGHVKWSRLGLDTWLYTDSGPDEYRVKFFHDIGFARG